MSRSKLPPAAMVPPIELNVAYAAGITFHDRSPVPVLVMVRVCVCDCSMSSATGSGAVFMLNPGHSVPPATTMLTGISITGSS